MHSTPIVIVDDDLASRELLSRRLVRSGHHVVALASGREALDYLGANTVSMVLLDWQMPEMSGLEVLQAIRARWSELQLPVLMVTAKDDASDIITALDLGASDYLTKPINVPVALARIRTQLSRKDVGERLRASEERVRARGTGRERWPVGLGSRIGHAVFLDTMEGDCWLRRRRSG